MYIKERRCSEVGEVNCMNCIVGRFKDSLCPKEFCEKFKCAGESDDFIKHVLKVESKHGECKTCKHFIRGGLDGKTQVCEHPAIEQDDYYNYACLMVEENDYCSSYEKKEGDKT